MSITNEDILKAMESEKNKKLAGSLQHPQQGKQITAEEIVKNHQEMANPGRGNQRIGVDSKMGAPQPKITGLESITPENAFNIPGLLKAIKNDKHN